MRTGLEALGVAEQGDRLGGAHQQVGGEAAGGQDAGQVLGGGALVAEQAQVPGGLAEGVGDLAEVQQAGVRVGGVREPAEHDGQQGALDGGLAGDAGGEGFEVAQGGGRVGVPEGFEALAGGARREPGLTGGELGDGVEQRPVEELLVEAADHGGVAAPGLVELGDGLGAQAEGAAEAAQVGLVLGDEVGAAQPVELDAVLHGAQEPVRVVQLGGVGAADVAAGGEGVQGVEGGAGVEGGVAAAVDELEQLDGELDVAQAAGAEFELAVDLGGGDVVDDAAAHLLDVGDEVLALGGLPDERRYGIDVLGAELLVAGDGAGLEQGLELPGLRPALVVREMGGEGTDEGAVAALGAEVGVDGPDGALDGGLGADPHQVGGEAGGGLEGLGLVGAVRRVADEDDVDVGDVIQLVAAALAHGDDGEAALRRVLGGGGARDAQGRAEGGGGQVGELGGGLGDVDGAADVAGGDGEQAAAVGDAQRDGVVRLGQALLELGEAGVQVGGLVGDEGVPVAGVAGEVVGEGLGGAEHAEEAVAQGFGADEGVEEDGALLGGLRLGEAGEAAEGEVGVGGGAEGVEEGRVGAYGGQLVGLQQPGGGRGVGEAAAQQPHEGTAPASRGGHPPPPAVAAGRCRWRWPLPLCPWGGA